MTDRDAAFRAYQMTIKDDRTLSMFEKMALFALSIYDYDNETHPSIEKLAKDMKTRQEDGSQGA